MEAMGVPGVQMEELYSLDADSMKTMKPVHGLIFLFRWTPEAGADDRAVASEAETPPGLFFARQVATNACATQAILSILLNRPGKVKLGGAAATLKEFCAGLPPDVAGLALASCDPVREAHNSFAPPSSLVQEDKKASSDEDAFHFVAYLPFGELELWRRERERERERGREKERKTSFFFLVLPLPPLLPLLLPLPLLLLTFFFSLFFSTKTLGIVNPQRDPCGSSTGCARAR
jgi:hypothetical protein